MVLEGLGLPKFWRNAKPPIYPQNAIILIANLHRAFKEPRSSALPSVIARPRAKAKGFGFGVEGLGFRAWGRVERVFLWVVCP